LENTSGDNEKHQTQHRRKSNEHISALDSVGYDCTDVMAVFFALMLWPMLLVRSVDWYLCLFPEKGGVKPAVRQRRYHDCATNLTVLDSAFTCPSD
jgi:hypothetical protein